MSEKEISRIQINGDLYHLSDNDTREQIVSLSSKFNDLSNFKLSGGIIPLNIKHLSGETIQLSNDYNCYCLTPSATLNLQFDNSNVSEFDGGEFYLMIDLSDGIQTINFPNTFKWKDNTTMPNISNTSMYIFKCTYLYTDPIAYIGELITSVTNADYDKGLWIFTDSDRTQLYSNFDSEFSKQGDLYVNLLTLNRDNNAKYYIEVNKDAQVNEITFTSHNSLDEIGNVVVNINDGGRVERINIDNDEWSDFYYSHPGVSVKVNNGGYLHVFNGSYQDWLTINDGGYVKSAGGFPCTINGGYVGSLNIVDDADPVTYQVWGGHIHQLFFEGGYYTWSTDVRIKNTKIDEITIYSTETNLVNMYEPFTNCEIGRFMVDPGNFTCYIGR